MSVLSGRVMVIEDNPVVRNIIVDRLREGGYPVDEASDGIQATSKLLSGLNPPSVIVLDLLMPGIDGYEILELIEGTESLSQICVLVMTGLDHPPLPEGMRILHKPVDPEQLLRAVEDCMPLDDSLTQRRVQSHE